jgi:uncharacterized protein YjdB
VVVTNTKGVKSATIASDTAAITITNDPIENAATPAISTQPAANTSVTVGASVTLNVVATNSDSGTLSYQWYKNTSNSNSGGTLVASAQSYQPSTETAGTLYYYVIVTNTNNSPNVNGSKTESVKSNVATVIVTAIPDAITITQIAAGGSHSLALDSRGKLWATGYNNYGQLGFGDSSDRKKFTRKTSLDNKNIIAIAAGDYHSLALDNQGKVYAAGYNFYGQLGLVDSTDRSSFTEVTANLADKNITQIMAGYYHTLALDNQGKVYSTGYNNYGQLGLVDSTDRSSFTEVTTNLTGKTITQIAAGSSHSLALDNQGKVYSTGYNWVGQLGLDDKSNRSSFTFADIQEETGIVTVSSISADRSSASIEEGATLQLTAIVYPTNATNQAITWESSNSAVASVSESGLVTGRIANGTATITARSASNPSISAQIQVSVTPASGD